MKSNKTSDSAVADNAEIRNAINVKVSINKKIKYNLLYDRKKFRQKN